MAARGQGCVLLGVLLGVLLVAGSVTAAWAAEWAPTKPIRMIVGFPPGGATDLVAGHVPVFFAVISTAVPPVQSGKARALAVTGGKRAEALPDVPTVAEAGVPGYAAENWYGLLAPVKTPAPVIARLNKELMAALKSPDVVKQLKVRGIDAAPGTPQDFASYIRAEQERWVPIIKQFNIKEE